MKTIAIIQARMSSERLPGKVLMPLGGVPVLTHVIGRLRRAAMLDEVVVATSDRADDDPIAALAAAENAAVYRGSLTDVLGRYAGAAEACGADVVVRVTADCPLICPEVVDAMVVRYRSAAGSKPSIVSNARVRTYPRGLDAEVFSRATLGAASSDAKELHQREHVTLYIYEHPEMFAVVDHMQLRNASAARWTLDTAEDYRMLQAFFALFADPDAASLTKLLQTWDAHPELHAINADVVQKHYAARGES